MNEDAKSKIKECREEIKTLEKKLDCLHMHTSLLVGKLVDYCLNYGDETMKGISENIRDDKEEANKVCKRIYELKNTVLDTSIIELAKYLSGKPIEEEKEDEV